MYVRIYNNIKKLPIKPKICDLRQYPCAYGKVIYKTNKTRLERK